MKNSYLFETILKETKPWTARGIEKAKKEKSEIIDNAPHKYSVHMLNLSTEQLFRLIAMNNTSKDVELFGFGLAKIDGRFYLYEWHPTESKQFSKIRADRLSTDFTDEMADDFSHWILNKEMFSQMSGRIWPIFVTGKESNDYEGVIVFGDSKSSINKYKKIYDKLIYGKNALPIEHGFDKYIGDVSEIPNKFGVGTWLSVNLDPEEIMSLGISKRDIIDDTLRKNYEDIENGDID